MVEDHTKGRHRLRCHPIRPYTEPLTLAPIFVKTRIKPALLLAFLILSGAPAFAPSVKLSCPQNVG